jgi:hypothetical protein
MTGLDLSIDEELSSPFEPCLSINILSSVTFTFQISWTKIGLLAPRQNLQRFGSLGINQQRLHSKRTIKPGLVAILGPTALRREDVGKPRLKFNEC